MGMGYAGKLEARSRAEDLRAQGWTMADIAAFLDVSKSSVSLWTRHVAFEPQPRRTARRRGPNRLQRRKSDEIEALRTAGEARLGHLSDQAFLAAGAALYAGEGSKRDGAVILANSDPAIVAFFCEWLRTFFEIDETRMKVTVYLHEGLDLEAAHRHWSAVTGVPLSQFRKPYRAVPDPSRRSSKHFYGCAYVRYNCAYTHRAIMGLVEALLSSVGPIPG
jgi:hypothetical protein